MISEEFRIWEGVYDDFPEEDPEHVFDSDQWIDKIAARARENLLKLKADVPISENAVVHEYPLPVLVALASRQSTLPVRVLDFGGGLGATYFGVAASLPARGKFDFHIVESVGVCRRGREIFHEYKDIHFYEQLPEVSAGGFDVVHAASSFQYVDDWRSLLERFSSYDPRYIVFGNLLAGAIRPFVTYQNYYGHKIPVPRRGSLRRLPPVVRTLPGSRLAAR